MTRDAKKVVSIVDIRERMRSIESITAFRVIPMPDGRLEIQLSASTFFRQRLLRGTAVRLMYGDSQFCERTMDGLLKRAAPGPDKHHEWYRFRFRPFNPSACRDVVFWGTLGSNIIELALPTRDGSKHVANPFFVEGLGRDGRRTDDYPSLT